jgi:hypothetical protein
MYDELAIKGLGFCGALEICNISAVNDPETVVVQSRIKILRTITGSRKPFLLFTGVTQRSGNLHSLHPDVSSNYGQALADFIVAQGLGEVVATPERANVPSGNMTRIWTWMPDYDKWDAFVQARTPQIEPAAGPVASVLTNIDHTSIPNVTS